MSRQYRLLLILFAFVTTEVGAQTDTLRLSLQQAVQTGLENNISIKSAEREVEVAHSQVKQATSIGLPQIGASLRYDDDFVLPTFLLPAEFGNGVDPVEAQFGSQHNVNAGLFGSQLLFDGSYLIGVKAARTLVELQQRRVRLSEAEVKHQVTAAYYTALIAEQNVVLADNNFNNLQDLLSETRALFESGFVEGIDVDRLEMSASTLGTMQQTSRRDLEISYKLLRFSMGIDVNTPISLTDNDLGVLLADPNNLIEAKADPSARMEFQILQTQKDINDMNIRYMKAAYLPKLFFSAGYNQQAQRESFDFFDFDQPWYESASIGFELQIPIWDGFYKRSQVQQAQLQRDGIQLNEQQARLGLKLEAEQAKSAFLNALDQMKTADLNMERAQKIYDVSVTKYRGGIGSSLEISDAERQLYSSQQSYVMALYTVLSSRNDLNKALGKY